MGVNVLCSKDFCLLLPAPRIDCAQADDLLELGGEGSLFGALQFPSQDTQPGSRIFGGDLILTLVLETLSSLREGSHSITWVPVRGALFPFPLFFALV